MKYLILTILCLSTLSASERIEEVPLPVSRFFNPSRYKIEVDLDMSPYAGGEDLLFGVRSLERIEDWLIGNNPVTTSRQAYGQMWRLAELCLVWLPIDYFTTVLQHEVFGHGFVIRSFPSNVARCSAYHFGTPLPYGSGGGATFYKLSSKYTTTHDATSALGGVTATAILGQLTKMKWLEAGKVDPRQALLYLFAEQDLTLYIGSLETNDADLDGHDITAYVNAINWTYTARPLSKSRLKDLRWINWIDPFTFYALYSWFRYLSTGKETHIPLIASCYLPNLRLGLTPFGPEIFLENYCVFSKKPLYAYARGGRHANNNYGGIGVWAPTIQRWDTWALGARVDVWFQPRLLLYPVAQSIFDIDLRSKPDPQAPLYTNAAQKTKRFGAAGSLSVQYWVRKQWGFEAELGYKSRGFLPGYSLDASPVVRASYALMF